MKKLFLSCMAIMIASTIFAQETGTGGVRRGGTSLEMKTSMKERLKTNLSLSDSQADSVASIQSDFSYKIRAIRTDASLSEEDKKSKIASLNADKRQQLKQILTDDQLNKLNDMRERRRGQRHMK